MHTHALSHTHTLTHTHTHTHSHTHTQPGEVSGTFAACEGSGVCVCLWELLRVTAGLCIRVHASVLQPVLASLIWIYRQQCVSSTHTHTHKDKRTHTHTHTQGHTHTHTHTHKLNQHSLAQRETQTRHCGDIHNVFPNICRIGSELSKTYFFIHHLYSLYLTSQ